MRKIIDGKNQERKATRNKIIVGVVLIGVMLFSVIGYAFRNSDEDSVEKVKYNGVDFVLNNGGWGFELDGRIFSTKFNPKETEDIFVPDIFLENYQDKELYVSIDTDWENEVKQEIGLNLRYFATRIQDACLDENCSENYPIKDCYEDNIIVVGESENNLSSIEKKANCVFVSAPENEQVKAIDAILFKLLGI